MATFKRRFDPTFHFSPPALHFDGVTNEEGKIELNFTHKKLRMGPQFELVLSKITLQNEMLFNIKEDGQEFIVYGDDRFDFGKSKIVDSEDLVNRLNFIQRLVHFETRGKSLAVDLVLGKLYLSKGIARALRILDPFSDKVNAFVEFMNGNFVIKMVKDVVEIDASNTSLGEEFFLPYNPDFYVYNLISSVSPQAVFVYTDLMREEEMVSSQFTTNLAIIPVNEKYHETRFVSSIRLFKRAKDKKSFSNCYVKLADSAGRPLSGVRTVLEIELKRRPLT